MNENPSANKSDFNWSLLTKLLYDVAPEVQTFAIATVKLDSSKFDYQNRFSDIFGNYGYIYNIIKGTHFIPNVSEMVAIHAASYAKDLNKTGVIFAKHYGTGKYAHKTHDSFKFTKYTINGQEYGIRTFYINPSDRSDRFEKSEKNHFIIPFFEDGIEIPIDVNSGLIEKSKVKDEINIEYLNGYLGNAQSGTRLAAGRRLEMNHLLKKLYSDLK